MGRREIWILVLAVVLIGAIWTIHSSLDTVVATDQAPVERTDDQNTGTNAPNEQAAPAGTATSETPAATTTQQN